MLVVFINCSICGSTSVPILFSHHSNRKTSPGGIWLFEANTILIECLYEMLHKSQFDVQWVIKNIKISRFKRSNQRPILLIVIMIYTLLFHNHIKHGYNFSISTYIPTMLYIFDCIKNNFHIFICLIWNGRYDRMESLQKILVRKVGLLVEPEKIYRVNTTNEELLAGEWSLQKQLRERLIGGAGEN